MLNELIGLNNTLKNVGIEIEPTHRFIKPKREVECIRVEMKEAAINDIEYIENASIFWKIEPSEKENFPLFKINLPIVKLKTLSDKITKEKISKEKADEFYSRLVSFPEKLIGVGTAKKDVFGLIGKDDAFYSLIKNILKTYKEDVNKFIIELCNKIKEQYKLGLINEALVNRIFGIETKNKDSILLVLDTKDKIASDKKIKETINKRLLSLKSNQNKVKCSLTGIEGTKDDKSPVAYLPVIGRTILFSANKNIPCLERYNKIGSDIFVTVKETTEELNNALGYITSKDKENVTWRSIKLSKNHACLLIAYVSSALDVEAVKFIWVEEKKELNEQNFLQQVKEVFEKLDRKKVSVDQNVNFIILEKVDDGRTQVIYSDSFTVQNIKEKVDEWVTAFENYTMPVLSPEQVYWVISNHAEKQTVHIKDIFDLYLSNLPEKRIKYFIKEVLNNIQILKHIPKKTIATLSMLLYKLNIPKEVCMKNSWFVIGQYLALFDNLQKEYCKDVRKGNLPARLIGNEMLSVAEKNPVRAVFQISKRGKIYLNWAKVSENALAKFFLKKLRELDITPEKFQNEIKEVNESNKAMLYLGYVLENQNEKEEN